MTRDEVGATLGPPDEIGGTSRTSPVSSVYKYGAVELHFEPAAGRQIRAMAYTEDENGNGVVLLR